METKIKKAVFPVGGLGTRFLPATKALPKEMLPVASKPLIQHAFEEARSAGIEEFIFITGRNKNIITNHFDCVYELETHLNDREKHDALALTRDWVPNAGNIAFIRQQHPLGLGHAVWCARHFIKDEPFAVLLADEMFLSNTGNHLLSDMIAMYNETEGNIIAVADVDPQDTHKYGIIHPQDDNGTSMRIVDMIEKPSAAQSPSNVSIVGRYILNSDIFTYIEKTSKGAGGEIQLTDAMKAMIETCPTYGYRFDGMRLDCGNHLGYFEANLQFAIHDPIFGKQAREYIKNIAKEL
jgi:UTP--glucose-1-phosphate uridylyltransferase